MSIGYRPNGLYILPPHRNAGDTVNDYNKMIRFLIKHERDFVVTTFFRDMKHFINDMESRDFPRSMFTYYFPVVAFPLDKTIVEIVGVEQTGDIITNTCVEQDEFKGHSFVFEAVLTKKGWDSEQLKKDYYEEK